MKESDIHSAVIQHWRSAGKAGTLVATIPNQKAFGQPGLTKGLPDLLILGPKGVAFMELKAENGKLRKEQKAFRDLCNETGVSWFLGRGRDEPIAILRELDVVK